MERYYGFHSNVFRRKGRNTAMIMASIDILTSFLYILL